MKPKPIAGFGLSVVGPDETAMREYFDKLSHGGDVTLPLEKAAWGDIFGMCVDKFGVTWMINVSAEPELPS
jgi:PhnB protein